MSEAKTFRVALHGREQDPDSTAIVGIAATKLVVGDTCIRALAADGSVIFSCELAYGATAKQIGEAKDA